MSKARESAIWEYVKNQVWYVHVNDILTGTGWCVTNTQTPPSMMDFSEGEIGIADFAGMKAAEHIVELHNESLANVEDYLDG